MEVKEIFGSIVIVAMTLFLGASYLAGNTNHLLFTGFTFIAIVILMSVSWITQKIDELIEVAKED